MADESQISAFYAYKKILITGGTGCVGKALIWKLLQSCPKLDIIYVLIRSKRGKNPLSRKEDVFGSPVIEVNFLVMPARILSLNLYFDRIRVSICTSITQVVLLLCVVDF